MTTQPTAPVTPERIYQLAFAYAPPLVLEAAIKHRVFDVLDSGPKSLQEVSQATGAARRQLPIPRSARNVFHATTESFPVLSSPITVAGSTVDVPFSRVR